MKWMNNYNMLALMFQQISRLTMSHRRFISKFIKLISIFSNLEKLCTFDCSRFKATNFLPFEDYY